jgi:hypothetical protein
MFGILVSAFNSVLTWFLTQVVIKFVVFTAFFLIVSAFTAVLVSLLPSASSIDPAFAALDSGTAFFLNALAFPFGVSALLAAYATRFIIRRIPVIG